MIISFYNFHTQRNRKLKRFFYRMTDYDHFWISKDMDRIYNKSYYIDLMQNKLNNKMMKSRTLVDLLTK